ncbi:MAG: hypothetical protein PHE09_20980 [Oscillospiraceae bacterium]|nr:hypothetical protein [Oscillospiraceae bacterium]
MKKIKERVRNMTITEERQIIGERITEMLDMVNSETVIAVTYDKETERFKLKAADGSKVEANVSGDSVMACLYDIAKAAIYGRRS